MIAKVQNFVGEVLAEMKKVSWVTRQELWDSTLIVIAASL
ncbi:MAG: preprotein translocase subunit SecE, partial [Candidatus Omnitrophica bacterium]|nr:preprotein translocase subunit SecE [Candidatus Omnitrophota bacterium]